MGLCNELVNRLCSFYYYQILIRSRFNYGIEWGKRCLLRVLQKAFSCFFPFLTCTKSYASSPLALQGLLHRRLLFTANHYVVPSPALFVQVFVHVLITSAPFIIPFSCCAGVKALILWSRIPQLLQSFCRSVKKPKMDVVFEDEQFDFVERSKQAASSLNSLIRRPPPYNPAHACKPHGVLAIRLLPRPNRFFIFKRNVYL